MGTNECSQPASKSSWDSQDFVDVNMVLKMVHFHKSSRPQWVNGTAIVVVASSDEVVIMAAGNYGSVLLSWCAKIGSS